MNLDELILESGRKFVRLKYPAGIGLIDFRFARLGGLISVVLPSSGSASKIDNQSNRMIPFML
jgi:hypothetical protein